MAERWRRFWQQQQKPLHQRDDDAFYTLHGAELALLTGGLAGRRILEIGCGDGALFAPIGFGACTRYVGVDFSPLMLEAFRKRHGDVDLRLGDGISIPCDEIFDLVFSNGVAQYLDLSEFRRHLDAVKARLTPGGQYVCGSLPARERRISYVCGRGVYPPLRQPLRVAKELVRLWTGRSSLGQWFSLHDIHEAAQHAGLKAQVFGSLCYLYRYHVVFSRN
ncbi:MAG: methyltransferase domain-containing protein [Gammaproteobacteria bacterium]|nr:MAG: methyltransferase domain-containing protein [Gammaproteobacteria bacterium]